MSAGIRGSGPSAGTGHIPDGEVQQPDVTIRPMRDRDIPAVIDVMLGNWDGELARYQSAEMVARCRRRVTAGWLHERMEQKQVFVAERDGEVLATGALADFGEPGRPAIFLSQIFVRDGSHRQGIGSALVAHLVALAAEQSAGLLHVHSSRNATQFYRRFGFRPVEPQPEDAIETILMTMNVGTRDALRTDRHAP